MDYSVNVLQFAEARASEIASLMHEVTSDNNKKKWFQRLPHYMRRRGASQNPKLVPRKLQEQNKEKVCKSKYIKEKHRLRKKPRKNTSSTATDHTWLETHIWHAKRFKMETHWDYRLPIHSTDRKLGTSHRAAANRCMIQDLSYYCCIELIGFEDELISKLSCLSDATSGHTFASEMFLDGAKEGHCFLYHPHSYPFKAIGPVAFLWEPRSDLSSLKMYSIKLEGLNYSRLRKLWIWCHPSFHDELAQVLISTLTLAEDFSTSENTRSTFPCKLKHKKAEPHFQSEKRYCNLSTKMEMNLLEKKFARHRLIGPMSLQILSRVLQVADVCTSPFCIETSSCENGSSDKEMKQSDSLWWKSYYMDEESRKEEHDKQQDLWNCLKDVQSSYHVTPKSVIGLTVRDPRSSSRCAKESSTVPDGKGNCKPFLDFDELFTSQMAASPLWNRDIRNKVTATKLHEHLINEERSKCIVTPDLGEKENRIPVIIVHQPALTGFGSSWDLIAPLGWSLEFWRSYERNGALPTGLRDLRFVNLEAGLPDFPCSFPDTAASKKTGEILQSRSLSELKRHPKSQRPNFSALAIPTPFFMDWRVLVKEWELQIPALISWSLGSNQSTPLENPHNFSFEKNSVNVDHALNAFEESNNTVIAKDDGQEFYVLRKMDGLSQLCDHANKVSRYSQSKLELKALIDSFAENSFKSQTQFTKSLILVKIKCLNKGSPLTHAGIYLLSNDDLKELTNNPKFSGPTEPNHSEKKNALQSKSKETPISLIESSTRKMIGCLSEGGFSSICGHGIGIGHCTSIGFLMMLKQCAVFQLRPVVLWRNQHSFQFRVANIEPIENYL